MTTITPDLKRIYTDSDALRLAELVRAKEVTPSELTEIAIGFIEELDPKLNAVVIRDFDRARRRAAQAPGDGPFAGVPYLLKNIGSACEGLPMTAGLEYRKDFVSRSDSELVRKVKAAGLNILGRTNVPENGWCIATEPRFHGPTLNPWNPEVTPGGSSGGAAAAVASRMVPMAEGTDGGGSIRVPASCCGLLGLKPSRRSHHPRAGRGRYLVRQRLSLRPDPDRTGRRRLARRDRRDAAGRPLYAAGSRPALAGRPRRQAEKAEGRVHAHDALGTCFRADVADAVKSTVALLEQLGHEVEEHAFATDLESAWVAYNQVNSVQVVLEFEALAKEVGRPVRQSDLVAFNWAQLERGKSQSATAYAASLAAMRKANQQIQRELLPYDVFLTPTLTQPPRPVGYWDMNEPDFDRYNAKWSDAAFMFAFNISGLPPCRSRPHGRIGTYPSGSSSSAAWATKPRSCGWPRR